MIILSKKTPFVNSFSDIDANMTLKKQFIQMKSGFLNPLNQNAKALYRKRGKTWANAKRISDSVYSPFLFFSFLFFSFLSFSFLSFSFLCWKMQTFDSKMSTFLQRMYASKKRCSNPCLWFAMILCHLLPKANAFWCLTHSAPLYTAIFERKLVRLRTSSLTVFRKFVRMHKDYFDGKKVLCECAVFVLGTCQKYKNSVE